MESCGLTVRFLVSALVLTGMAGCAPSYSPDTYASNAAQQANKVEQGVIAGVRPVGVSATGTVGTVTGAAAGGIVGSQVATGAAAAFTSLGGALVGGLGGSAVEHMTADTAAFEYIVRKTNGDLVSVTQRDKTPLALGEKVLVIGGTQARVVPDYTVPPLAQPKPADAVRSAPGSASPGATPGAAGDTAAPADGPAGTPGNAATIAPAAMPAVAAPVAAALDGSSSATILPPNGTAGPAPDAKPAGSVKPADRAPARATGPAAP